MSKKFTNVLERFLPGTDQSKREQTREPIQPPKPAKASQKELKTARTYLLLKQSTKDAIRAAATAQGYSLNDFVSRILDDYIKGAKDR